MTNEEYFEKFKNLMDVVENCGGGLGDVKSLQKEITSMIAVDPENPDSKEIAASIPKSKERLFATMFFLRADPDRYKPLHRHIQNEHLEGNDKYPETLVAAYHRLVGWIPETKHRYGSGPSNDGVSFANVGKNYKDISTIKCHKCHKMGHYANNCPTIEESEDKAEKVEENSKAHQFLNAGMDINDYDFADYDDEEGSSFLFNQMGNVATYKGITCEINSDGRVDKNWILLDNQSTVDVFYNKQLLRNIRQSKTGMEIHCNAGTTTTYTIGEFPGYGTVWFHPEGIANILSLSRISKR